MLIVLVGLSILLAAFLLPVVIVLWFTWMNWLIEYLTQEQYADSIKKTPEEEEKTQAKELPKLLYLFIQIRKEEEEEACSLVQDIQLGR